MNVKFEWIKEFETYSPCCTSDALYKDGFSLLDCILHDDGGIGYIASLSWLNEALKNIGEIKTHQLESYNWSRETWGADININRVIIYSLLEEDYCQTFNLKAFEAVLEAWVKFIQCSTKNKVELNFNIFE